MIRLVISNQRGGVSKTTTTTTLARAFSDRGKRVLMIDTDPQGSISSVLGLKPEHGLYNFVIEKLRFDDCIVKVSERVHVLCSNRETTKVETILMGNVAREHAFSQIFSQVDQDYDVVLIDVSPIDHTAPDLRHGLCRAGAHTHWHGHSFLPRRHGLD